jgi:hypothetical protein
MAEATPEPEGSEDEVKRKFREALERKRGPQTDKNSAGAGKDSPATRCGLEHACGNGFPWSK